MPTALDPNTGQRITDEKLAFDPTKTAKNLEDAENSSDTPDSNESLEDREKNGAGFVDKTTKSGSSNRDGGRFNMGKLRGSKKKPLGVIGGLLIGGGAVTLLFGAPAMLFATAASVMTNAKNYAAPASNHRGMLMLSKRIAASVDTVRNGACQINGVRCKSSTMSDKQVQDLRKAGIQVDSDEANKIHGRHIVTEIRVPIDGQVNADGTPKYLAFGAGEDINKKLKRNPAARSALYKGYNPLTASFFDSKFIGMLKKGFSTDKGDKFKGTTEKELRESARSALGVEGIEGDANGRATPEERQEARETRQTSFAEPNNAKLKTAVGRANEPLAAICMAYDLARAVTAAAKAKVILDLGRIFVVYASEMHRYVSSSDTATNEGATFLGNNMNYSEYNKLDEDGKPNRFYNSSFFDAEGMKMILHGDVVGLLWFSKKYIVGGSGLLATIDAAKLKVENAAGGKANLKTACKVLNSGLICAIFVGSNTAVGAGVGGAAGTVVPGPGNAVGATGGAVTGALIGVGECLLLYAAVGLAMYAASPLIEKGIMWLAEQLAELELDDDTKGIDLGNAVAAGAGLVLGRMAQERGLRPSSLKTQKQYVADTAEERQEIAAMYRYEARETPFNVANQYSFMGTIARSIYNSGGYSPSLLGNVSRLFGILPASAHTLATVGTADAAWVMRDNDFKDGWYVQPNGENVCPDPAPAGNNLSPDAFCAPAFDMPKESMKMSIKSNEDFMIDGKYVDEVTGEPLGEVSKPLAGPLSVIDDMFGGILSGWANDDDDDPGHKYAMFKEYCANRDHKDHGGYGDTTVGIGQGSDADENWRTGFFCSNPAADSNGPSQTELNNFYAYTMDHGDGGTEKTMDEVADGGGDSASGPYSKNTGPWVIPTSGPCLSPFGPRGGAHHAGVDISPPSGTPIVAPTSMEITEVGDKGDGYGTSVVATATDDSGNSFRFAHMIAGSPTVTVGQKVSKGDTIGQVGSTGDSTGPHLHFEIFPPGAAAASYSGSVDPIPVLSQHQVSLSCGG